MPFIVWSSGPAGQLQRTLDLVFILLFGHYGTFYLRTWNQMLKLCKFRRKSTETLSERVCPYAIFADYVGFNFFASAEK